MDKLKSFLGADGDELSSLIEDAVNTETGEVVKKVDEKNKAATEVTREEIEQIYQGQGFTHLGTLLHTHASPGCVYYVRGGRAYKICW